MGDAVSKEPIWIVLSRPGPVDVLISTEGTRRDDPFVDTVGSVAKIHVDDGRAIRMYRGPGRMRGLPQFSLALHHVL
jgi:hypothetical protein